MQPLNIADITKDQLLPWTVSTLVFYLCLILLFLVFEEPLIPPVLQQSENPDHGDQIKSLLCTPIRNGKKDKVIGTTSLLYFSIWFKSL